MRESKFTEAQIIAILKQAERGAKVADMAREHGTNTQALYNTSNWHAK